MKAQNLVNTVKLSLQHHLELLFLTHQKVNWPGIFKTILCSSNCISFSLQFTSFASCEQRLGYESCLLLIPAFFLHYLALEEHLLSIHQHGVCATTIWAANCWCSQRGAVVLPSIPTAVPLTAGVPWWSSSSRSLIPNWDGAPWWHWLKRMLGKLCQCSSAALGNSMHRGHPLGWLILGAKPALWSA